MMPIGNLSRMEALKGLGRHALIESTKHGFNPSVDGATPTVNRFNQPGHAYAFDGLDDYIEVPDNPALSLRGEYSLVITFKANALPSNGSGVVHGNTVVMTMHLLQKKGSYNASIIRTNIGSGPPYLNCSLSPHALYSVNIVPNQYYQLTFTYARRTLRVVLNGETKEQIPNVDEPAASTEPLLLGKSAYPQEIHYDRKFFKGVMDQLQFFDWALSNEEIAKLYASGVL